MKNGYFIKNSLEDCCNSFYSWDFTKCMILGGASSSAYATNEFYVDYQTGSCKQSCLEGTAGLNCAGIASNWMNVFATAEECCEKTLWWVEASTCVAHSTLTPSTTAAGSSEWYGDYTMNKVCSFFVPLYLARYDHLCSSLYFTLYTIVREGLRQLLRCPVW